MKSNSKKNLNLILSLQFFSALYFIKIIHTLYYQNKGISLAYLGIILGSYQLSKIIFEIPTGIIADKYGRRISIAIGFICMQIFLILTLFSNRFGIFIIAAIFQGIGATFISGADAALLIDTLIEEKKEEDISKYSGLRQVLFYYALSFSALFGGFFTKYFKYDLLYFAQVIAYSIPLILLYFIKEPAYNKSTEKNKLKFSNVYKYVKTNNIVMYLILVYMMIGVAFIPIDSYYSNYLIRNGIKENFTGIIMFFQQVLGAFAVYKIITKLKLKSDEKKINLIKIFPILMMISLAIAFFSTNMIVGILIYFIGQMLFILVNPLIFEITQKNINSEFRATIGSFFSFGLSIVAICVHLLYGFLSSIYGMKNIFLFLIIISTTLLFSINKIYEKERNKTNPNLSKQSY